MTATPHDASLPGSTVVWRITGTVSNSEINTTFTVPSVYAWQRDVQSIKLPDPCSGTSTLIVRTDGTLGKRVGRPTIWLQGTQATNAATDLETVWAKIGPWTLTTPTETMTVLADATQGGLVRTNAGTHIEIQLGLQET